MRDRGFEDKREMVGREGGREGEREREQKEREREREKGGYSVVAFLERAPTALLGDR